MKFSLLLVFAVTYLNAAPTPDPVDYREKYDHLLMEMINERIAQGERFLEHVSHQLKEFETTKKEDVRQSILKELEFILPLVKQADQHFATELKKTGLNLIEKFTISKAKAELDLVIKFLTDVQSEIVKKFDIMVADPVDWREEYDRLLYEEISEHILQADSLLLRLQRELSEYLKTKSAEIKAKITEQVEFSKPFLNSAIERTATQLKRTDLNYVERFLYEKTNDEAKLLLKHYQQIEAELKKPEIDYNAATASPVIDWRSEYDRLLFEMVEENVRKADHFLLQLVRQVKEYKESKEESLKERIIREVDLASPLVKSAIDHAVKELKRTDLDHIERYLYEKIRDEATILNKYYTALEKEVKP